MPIKPKNKKLYPDNWQDIRERILQRANYECEGCGVKQYSVGHRDVTGKFWSIGEDWEFIHNNPPDMHPDFGDDPKQIKIVLTIAHLDHNPENCEDDNLKAWCQKCHNSYDAEHRVQTRKATAVQKQIDAGQQFLFGNDND